MKDSDDPGIQEWMMGIILVLSQDHDIAMRCIWVDGVLFSTNIVRRIVDTKNIV
jgi:hypothetical protein